MIQCPQCGADNPEGSLVCFNCYQPFKLEIAKDGSTRRLEQVVKSQRQTFWGTARLGDERKLLFHIRNYDEPLEVQLHNTIVLGRTDVESGQTPDVDFSGYGAQEQGVSRRHAVIMVEDDTIKVMDLGSANATYMNGQRLIANQPRILRDGDELRLGKLVMRVNFL
jgi:hypothetical protein